MKKSTIKKLEKRKDSLPVYFVDSSVFLEVLFAQKCYEDCTNFFNRTGYRYQLMTSIEAMGEAVKALNERGYDTLKEKGMLLLAGILDKTGIKIASPTFEAISNVSIVRDADSYIMPSDCLIFSIALTEGCFAFVTLDRHFTALLCNKFKIALKKPSEA
ncbi:MAG: type II toxin-antitoxin system VapC family toxin [Nanoarchaeota archaeon]|nr:type II toxin-antitoxin system VapC family toxin [Nanoarchaeota archaeon]